MSGYQPARHPWDRLDLACRFSVLFYAIGDGHPFYIAALSFEQLPKDTQKTINAALARLSIESANIKTILKAVDAYHDDILAGG